ncbi:MAG TPA: hypothetical protein PLD14_00195 [Candidatus Pacearchaeota archaeon]|nr:hypothetical protein [Candidatus Pacearchaeota archaeon]HPR79634.1 hypothetical protein [Candidatus Pacearchaeota archaeon]
MNKISKIIILSVLTLILITTGYFLYNKWQESKMGLVSFEKVLEQEIDGKKYIENKEVGLTFAVPDGWEIKKDSIGLSIHSSDFIPLEKDSFFIPQKGCWIEVYAELQKEGSNYDIDYSYLKDKIASNYCSRYQNDEQKICETREVSGLNGLEENDFKNEGENQGIFTSFSIPYNNIIYSFHSYLFGQDKEVCLQEFNNFLTTVNIKK